NFEDCTGATCVATSTFTNQGNQSFTNCPSGGTCTSPYTWGYSGGLLAAGQGALHPAGIVNETITHSNGDSNDQHNDYLVSKVGPPALPVTFTFSYMGTITNASNVTFEWGTQPGTTSGTLQGGGGTIGGGPVPEPTSISLLLGTLFAGLM